MYVTLKHGAAAKIEIPQSRDFFLCSGKGGPMESVVQLHSAAVTSWTITDLLSALNVEEHGITGAHSTFCSRTQSPRPCL